MATDSNIEWTDHTLNPWIGCTKVGPGCDHCYAEALMDHRHHKVEWGGDRVRTAPSTWNAALKYERASSAFFLKHGRRQRVFCSSLADVFDNHKSIQPEWRMDLAALVLATPSLDWLFLTKRIGFALRYLMMMFPDGVPSNVRVGATIVNQDEWDRDHRKIAAVSVACQAKPFLSMEPLLGRVNLETDPTWKRWIGWVIVGGESGNNARPMHPEWAVTIRDQCEQGQVPFLFKQWGEWVEIDGPKTRSTPVSRQLRGPNVAYVMNDGEIIAQDHRLWRTKTAWGDYLMARIGKKAAGRKLRDATHTEFPR